MFHVYKDGYSVLPKLTKISEDLIFQHTDQDTEYYKESKIKSLTQHQCFSSFDETETHKDICQWIVDKYPRKIDFGNLCEITLQTQEDFVIHKVSDTDFCHTTSVFFPTGWYPERSIGLPLHVLHHEIPGINLANSRKLLEAMVKSGPFERFVWSPIYENKLNFHPNLPRKVFENDFWMKIERQCLVGFPQLNCFLFILRPYILNSDELDLKSLYNSLIKMNDEEKKYKGIKSDFIEHLEKLNGRST
jgi:hypothetical protein